MIKNYNKISQACSFVPDFNKDTAIKAEYSHRHQYTFINLTNFKSVKKPMSRSSKKDGKR